MCILWTNQTAHTESLTHKQTMETSKYQIYMKNFRFSRQSWTTNKGTIFHSSLFRNSSLSVLNWFTKIENPENHAHATFVPMQKNEIKIIIIKRRSRRRRRGCEEENEAKENDRKYELLQLQWLQQQQQCNKQEASLNSILPACTHTYTTNASAYFFLLHFIFIYTHLFCFDGFYFDFMEWIEFCPYSQAKSVMIVG